jgi:hypothetical protein
VARSFALIHEQFGAPYGIFANAGIDVGGLIHEMPLELWQRILDTNLTGIFPTCKYGLQQMLEEQTTGSIVCTSPASFVAFAADQIETMRAQLRREIPLGRLAEPKDPARVVLWLLSDESAYTTGSHVVCDGGILAKSSISVWSHDDVRNCSSEVRLAARTEEIGRVPHVRTSVRGPKKMGAALQSLFLNPQQNPYPQPGCFVGLRVEVCAMPSAFGVLPVALIERAQFEREGIRRTLTELISTAQIIQLDRTRGLTLSRPG